MSHNNYAIQPDDISQDILEFLIPYYNSLEYLVECLDSLKAQDFHNFKVTVIDDCSADSRAKKIVEDIKDPRFSYIRNSENLGLPANFQNCVDRATSNWVIILGQDDKLPRNFVSDLWNYLDDMTLGFIQPSVRIIDFRGEIHFNLVDAMKWLIRQSIILLERKNRVNFGIKVDSRRILPMFLTGNPFYFPTIVWNRLTLQEFGFDQRLPITLDYDLIFRILLKGSPVLFLERTTAFYRRHNQSASGKVSEMLNRLEEEISVLNSFKKYLKGSSPLLLSIVYLRPTTRFHAIRLSFSELKYMRFGTALKYLGLAFKI